MLMKLIRNAMARRKLRRRLAKRIKACFDGIDLSRHSFNVGGNVLSSPSGDKAFYSAREVDEAINRINKLLAQLSS